MTNCKCNEENHVPDFATVGFDNAPATQAQPSFEGVYALNMSACVSASYDPNTNQICFTVPIYGNLCVTSPVKIPVGGKLKACAQTCGSIIPTGLKATIYLNDSPIWSGTLVGSC